MPLIWPTTDAFDDGSPVLKRAGYYAVALNTTNYQYGALQDGWQPTGGFGSALRDASGGNDGKSIGFIRRETIAADCTVQALLAKQAATGVPPDADAVQRQGVIARMTQAGVGPLYGNNFAYLEDATCYTFELRNAGGGQLKLGLYRFDLGFENVLVESAPFDAKVGGYNLRGLMSLNVTTTGGGDVLLTAGIDAVLPSETGDAFLTFDEPGGTGAQEVTAGTSPTQGGTLVGTGGSTVLGGAPRVDSLSGRGLKKPPVDLPPPDDTPITVLTFTDTDVNRIVADGRCGLILDDEVDVAQPSGAKWVSGCEMFAIIEGGTVVWLDDFTRSARDLCRVRVDAFGIAGRDMGCDYSADLNGRISSGWYSDGAAGEVNVQGLNSLGNAPDLPGTALTNNNPFLNPATGAYPLPPGENVLEVSYVIWANLDTSRDGNCFLTIADAAPITEGWRFRWLDLGAGNAALSVEMHDADGTDQTFTTAAFTAATFVGQTYAYGFTYKAGHYTNGDGRLRIYRGRFGTATLVQEFTVPAATRPKWLLTEHRIGDSVEVGAPAADRYLDGRIDRMSAFYTELDATDMSRLMDEFATDALITSLGAVHSVDFEGSTFDGTYRYFPVWTPASAITDWRMDVTVTLTTGLVSTLEDSTRHMIWQRPADDPGNHARKVTGTITEGIGRLGVVLCGSGITTKGVGQQIINGGTYYRVRVGVGSPAPVYVERVNNGVAIELARENEGTSTANVTEDVEFELHASCARTNPDDPLSASLIAVEIDGVPVPLVTTNQDAGVAIDVDDNLVDASSDRVTSGVQTGLVMSSPSATQTFIEQVEVADILAGSGGGLNPNTLRTVQLPYEADEATGNLSTVLSPEWAVEIAGDGAFLDQRTQDQRTVRAPHSTYERRRLRLRSTRVPTAAEIEALRVFYEDHKGRVIPFAFTFLSTWLPNEPNGTWRFTSTRWSDTLQKTGGYVVSFDLEECVVRPAGVLL